MDTTDMVMHFDGSSVRNPGGPMGYGWHLDTEDGDPIGEQSGVILGYPPHERTCNTAELTALLSGLEWVNSLLCYRIGRLVVRGDSQLAVHLANGEWKTNKPHLADLTSLVREEIRKLELADVEVTVEWLPREQNARADELSTRDVHAGRPRATARPPGR